MKLLLIAGMGILGVKAFACADFSGHWKGTCQVQGVTSTDEQTAVQDGCSGIRLKNLYAPLGGTYTLVETFPGKAGGEAAFVNNSVTTQWDATMQAVELTETVNNRHVGGLSGDKPFILTGDMKKVDGRIHIELNHDGHPVIACDYDRD